MKGKDFFIGVVCGALAGFLTANAVTQLFPMTSDNVLHKVKTLLKEEGKVIGSWIMANPETVVKDSITLKVYRGGVTCLKEGKEVHYEFLVDAKTGMILELKS